MHLQGSLRLQREQSSGDGKGIYIACYRGALTTVANLTAFAEAAITLTAATKISTEVGQLQYYNVEREARQVALHLG
jgi:hypothetical protein